MSREWDGRRNQLREVRSRRVEENERREERRTSIPRTHSVHLEASHTRRSTHEDAINEMSSFRGIERKDETRSSGEGGELIETR